ncbi:MAG: hypothetical protein NT016_01165 [Candidatus Aenigmarchaeota archaeon]|nr:hypothetical protein [Candidatus Aenigmarchaeota archaeon]
MNHDETNVVMTLGALIAIAAGALFYFVYFYSPGSGGQSDAVLSELSSLSPDQHTLDIISAAKCRTLEKYDGYWVVTDCDGGVHFQIDFSAGGYMMLYCADGQTLQDRFVQLSGYLNKTCTDQSDAGTFLNNYGSDQLYSVCGYTAIVRGDCIVGVS